MTSSPTKPNIFQGQDLALTKVEPELLLVVFIHGFKGTDETFRDFPQRLEHLLSEIIPQVKVESVVFPAYETKGELDKAVVRFADWLTTLVVEREVASGLGAGKAKVVLCGHSMGGLLAADTLREFIKTRPDKDAPLWPKIVACLAFDTPYYGIHPFVVKNSVTKVAQYASTATTLGSALLGSWAGFSAKKGTEPPQASAENKRSSSPPPQASQSSWTSWTGTAAVGGAILAGAAAGVAYYKKDDLTQGFSWATDHLRYVGNLWDVEGLEQRVEGLIDIEKEHGVVFRTLYTILPPNIPEFLESRTFVVLPKYRSRAAAHFLQARNNIAADEIQGHTGMFAGSTNDGYYQLGLDTSGIIRDAVMSSRGVIENVPSSPRKSRRRTRSPTKEKPKQEELIQL